MGRRLLHHGAAAAVAAAALADAYAIAAVPVEGILGETVVLVDEHTSYSPPARGEEVRLIGLVESGATGPWPDAWYAVLPANAPPAMLARTVANAFADLEAAAETAKLERDLSELNAVGIRLSSEQDPRVLFETILSTARGITSSDAGSLYLVEGGADGTTHLRFALAQNDSVAMPFSTVTLPLTQGSVVGHVALTGQIVNLEDAYLPPPGSPFTINRWFDEQTGYRTKSMLVVPMHTPQGETIGALQLINCKPEWEGPLPTDADVERHVRPYTAHQEKLASSLASQAAVAVHNRRLYLSIHDLFEGFVKASVTAIEVRDPTTSGHSFRVAELAGCLAEIVNRCTTGPYAGVRFSANAMMELRYASLLHDFGKVGVREHVLVKAKKLYPPQLERIRYRVELLKRDLSLRAAQTKLTLALDGSREAYHAEALRVEAELRAALGELDRQLDLIATANEPTPSGAAFAAEIMSLAARTWADAEGAARTVLTPDEARILAIPRGTLTDQERRDIEKHVVHTYHFLKQIPWTPELRSVPEIAGSHHEKLNGRGYPKAADAAHIPVQSRMMTIADIYDALTASDRPYKKALPTEEALAILDAERRAGAIDAALLDLFIEGRVFESVSSSHAVTQSTSKAGANA
jgi:HD-GYP domain-containing protein (c-di-GMP phosphodiesterase class II)